MLNRSSCVVRYIGYPIKLYRFTKSRIEDNSTHPHDVQRGIFFVPCAPKKNK